MFPPRNWYVYIIQVPGFVKIGVSSDPEARLNRMQTGNPHELKIVALMPFGTKEAAFKHEKHMHKQLRKYRYRREWFRDHCLHRAFMDEKGWEVECDHHEIKPAYDSSLVGQEDNPEYYNRKRRRALRQSLRKAGKLSDETMAPLRP